MIEWRKVPIPEFSDFYSVSNYGDVYSNRTKRNLAHKISRCGYHRVTLGDGTGRQKTISVHRIVALAFIENPDNKPTVNHINEDKADNRSENLEWMTSAEQNRHGTRIVRAVSNTDWEKRARKIDYTSIAKKHNYFSPNMCNRKKCVVLLDDVVVSEHNTLKAAAKSVGANYSKASEVANGKRKSANGYVFRYVEEFPIAVTKLRFGEE